MSSLPSPADTYNQTSDLKVASVPLLQATITGRYGFQSGTCSPTAPCKMYKHEPLELEGTITSAVCHPPIGIAFEWTVIDVATGTPVTSLSTNGSMALSTSTNMILDIAGSTLNAAREYRATLVPAWQAIANVSIDPADFDWEVANTSITIIVEPAPITVSIQEGVAAQIGSAQELVLHSLVSDPDEGTHAMSYSWGVLNSSGMYPCPANLVCNDANFTVPAGTYSTAFTARLTVNKEGDSHSYTADIAVSVSSFLTVPVVSITRANQADNFHAESVLSLVGTCASCVTWSWEVHCVINDVVYDFCNPALNLNTSTVPGSGTSITTKDLTLMPNSLAPSGKQYRFTLTAADAAGVAGSAIMLVTTGHPPTCDSGCITVSPSTGTIHSMTTTVTVSAPSGSGSVPGWYDYDSDGTFSYSFGYMREGEKFMLNASPQSNNTLQTSSLPPGELTFFVTVYDPAAGQVGPVYLGQDSLLQGTVQVTTISAATDISSSALSSALDYDVSSTPPEEAFRIMSSVTANLDTSTMSSSDSDSLITKLADNLETVLAGAGGGMTDMAAGSLELISEDTTALTTASTDKLAACLDTTLNKAGGPLSANTALQLIEVTANLGQAHRSLNSRRLAWADAQNNRLITIALKAAEGLNADDPAIVLEAAHISGTVDMQLQNIKSTGLAGGTFGSEEYGAVLTMSSSFTATRRSQSVYTLFVAAIDTANSLNTNIPTKYTITSNLAIFGLGDSSNAAVQSNSGMIDVKLWNLADNDSPICLFWDINILEYKSAAEGGPCSTDVTRSYRTIGGAVVCQCSAFGQVAVGVGCDASIDCSGHGSCNMDATCKCDESYWGTDCSVQRCTDVTTCGPNDFHGQCVFNESATTAQAPGYPKPGCVSDPAQVCNPSNSSEFWQAEDISEDPQLYGDCNCFCGWSGPLCETKNTTDCTSTASPACTLAFWALFYAGIVHIIGMVG
jgi:hypothetical protein